MKFKTLVVDPPVQYRTYSGPSLPTRRLRQASAASHYQVMSWQELHALGSHIDRVADQDCALFLWICNPHIPEYVRLLESWRFAFKSVAFVWVKLNPKNLQPFSGPGYWQRSNVEQIWLATRGSPARLARDVQQVQEILERPDPTALRIKRGRHSQKPERFQDEIERLVAGPYMELFARRQRPGWVCVGDEIDGKDIRVALEEVAAIEQPLDSSEKLLHQTEQQLAFKFEGQVDIKTKE